VKKHLMSTGLVLTFLVIACGPSRNPESSLMISGGTLVEASEPASKSTVLVKSAFGNCTGVIIAPDFVLTAAHCKAGVGLSTIYLYDGAARIASSGIGVVGIALPNGVSAAKEDYLDDANVFADLALLRLAKPIPASYRAVSIASSEVASGFAALAVGAGRHNNDAAQAQTLQEKSVTVATNKAKEGYVFVQGSVTNPGDSGGPLYAPTADPNQLELLGIVHGREGHPVYWSVTRYTNATTQAAWIKQAMMNLRAQ